MPPRQVRKRLNLSVPSALPVRQPSSTDQYFGLPLPAVQVMSVEHRLEAFGRISGRYLLPRLQFLDSDVPPADLIGTLVLGDAVDLEADEATVVHIIGKVGGSDPVDPRPIAITLDDDPVAVPVVVLEGILGLWLDLGEPLAPSSFVVKPPRSPGLFAGYLALWAVDDPGPLAVRRIGVVLFIHMATDLNTRVEPGVALDVKFEHEVLEVTLAQEGVGAAIHGRADDHAILHVVGGGPAIDFPSIEGFAIEQRHPSGVGGEAGDTWDDGQGERQHRDRQGVLRHRRGLLSRFISRIGGRPNSADPGPSRQTYDDFRVQIEIEVGENETRTGSTSGR